MTVPEMATLTIGLSSRTIHSLGWGLVHFLWQGTALAALAASVIALCRQASARYVVAVTVLIFMLLAPLGTFTYFLEAYSGVPDSVESAHQVRTGWTAASARTTNGSGRPSASVSTRDVLPWLVETWLVGVACFSIRSAGGFLLVQRERRRQSSVLNTRLLEICHTLQDLMGIRRAIQYCECKWLQTPAVIGWFRPVVFLPIGALTGLSEDQLRSVIAHELAHIRRLDAFVNVFQICVETLFFYHPAVWWLNKRIRSEREHCCDEMAVSLCGDPVEYARALTLMEEWRHAPRLAMASNHGPLKERIVRVLRLRTSGAGTRGLGLTASVLCLAGALVAGNAMFSLAHPSSASASSAFHARLATLEGFPIQSAPATKPSPSHAQSGEASQSTQAQPGSSSSSYIDAMKSAGLADLTVDQLIALKTQDVTPDYVRALREQGLRLDVDKILAMRIQDVTPEYIRELREAGLNPDEDQLISLRIQGADANYYRELKQAGIQADVDRLISMKIQDVTPEYVRKLRVAGLNLTADQLISFKIQDITPEYLKALHDVGIDASADDAISMRIQDVTPEYVREIRALGLKPSPQELISMRIQDVTPEYIKALQSAGFKLDVSDLISAKIQDVTPEFIERARQHGFKDLSLQKIIQLRQLGILKPQADI